MTETPPPSHRPSPVQQRNGRALINTDTYIPYFLAALNNALSRSASAQYRREFGIGIGEWRVLSILANEPGLPASQICNRISADKAAVSRSLARLEKSGVLDASVSPSDPRRRSFSLNLKGEELHDKVLQGALEREAKLLDGVDTGDLRAMLKAMRIMHKNVQDM